MTTPFDVRDGRVVFVEVGDDGAERTTPIGGGISADGFAVVGVFRDGWLWGGYLRDVDGVWWFHGRDGKARFVSADADGFRVLDDDYGLDSTTVFLEHRPIPGADPASFALLEATPYFARDRHRLYVKGGTHFFHFDEIDTATAVANGAYVADRDDLFHYGSTLTLGNDAKPSAEIVFALSPNDDPRLLKDWLRKHRPDVVGWWHPDYDRGPEGAEPVGHDWFRTDRSVFFREEVARGRKTDLVFNRVRDADAASFRPLDAFHGRDADGVFCRWRRLSGADAATFEPLGGLTGRDRNAVFHNGYRVAGADPATFTLFDTRRTYGRDRERVFAVRCERTSEPFGHPDEVLAELAGVDPATFRPYGEAGHWAADATRVFLHVEHKKKIDAGSFRFLCDSGSNSWAQDRNGLYRSAGTMVVAGIDGGSFARLNDFWGRDDQRVFSFVTGAIQKSIDAASFEVTDDHGGARDSTTVFRVENGRIRKSKR